MAQLNELISTAQVDTPLDWEEIIGYDSKPKYVDEDSNVTIIKKVMSNITGVTLSGEINSQYITFLMDRYQDGIDLSDKMINICYKIAGTEMGEAVRPINVARSSTQIRFGWVLPYTITKNKCTIDVGIYCAGKEYEQDYVWKSKVNSYSTEEGFICESIVIPPEDPSWFDKIMVEIGETNKYVNDLNKKVDNLIGSATSDSEVIDIRLGEDGIIYNTAGNSVRTQFKKVNEKLETCKIYWS